MCNTTTTTGNVPVQPTFAVVAPPKRIDASTADARYTALSLLGRTEASALRSNTVHGGCLHVIADAGLDTVENDGVVLAVASDGNVSAAMVLAAYNATAATDATADTRRRVAALRKGLGDMHAAHGAFALVLYDASVGRVLAARTANSTAINYGFTADGTLVACAGLSSAALFPGCSSALDLTPLPSGRFIFGHRYVKPIEFTHFWGTAAANRSSVAARKAEDFSNAGTPVLADGAWTPAPAGDGADGFTSAQKLGHSISRWGVTGSIADNKNTWKRGAAAAADTTDFKFPPSAPARRLSPVAEVPSGPGTPMALPSKTGYCPPAMRAARAAAAATAAAATAAATEEADAQLAVAALPLSPRSGMILVDHQVAAALASQDAIVSSLEHALVFAMRTSMDGGARRSSSSAAASSDLRRHGSMDLRSSFDIRASLDAAAPAASSSSSSSSSSSAAAASSAFFSTASAASPSATQATSSSGCPGAVAASDSWTTVSIPLSLRIPEEDIVALSPLARTVSLEGSTRRGCPASSAAQNSFLSSRLRSSKTLDSESWAQALAQVNAVGRHSMENCRLSADLPGSTSCPYLNQVRASLDLVPL